MITLSLEDVRSVAVEVLAEAGMDERGCEIIADLVMRSERDGPRSHGLRMLPAYVSTLASGYANGAAQPQITQIAPGVLRGDGDNGFYQIAAEAARAELIALTRAQGIAAFTCANAHHLGGMRHDTEPLAEAGLVAIAVVNSLSMVVPQGGVRPVFGTNPMSFAAPRPGQAPIVWDQASSVVALMDVKMAAAEGHDLPYAGGLDAAGEPSRDPQAILQTRSLLPFGDHKGAAIALMVEVLGAALAGGTLAVDNAEREAMGGLNVKGGAILIALDPARFGHGGFDAAVARICAEIDGNGMARIPGDGRLARRARAQDQGVEVHPDLLAELNALRP